MTTATAETNGKKEAAQDDAFVASMNAILKASPTPPEKDDIIEGKIISKGKSAVYIDLPPAYTGIIYGREYINSRDILKKAAIGDSITAKVVDSSNGEGYVELSLREARKALSWTEAEELEKSKKTVEVTPKDANKGGLIIDWQGITGFLPASQLSSEHYPRVAEGDKDLILQALKKLIGQKLKVTIIGSDPKENKLIFSEKGISDEARTEMVSKYVVGEVYDGEVTGSVEFGVFVKLEDGLEGLVHISELDWALVENPKERYKPGEKVQVKVIEVKDGKVSLSIKRLKENPWVSAGKKYKQGDHVSGVVIKYNKHGALVSIEEGVAGLVHISEFGDEEKLKAAIELGKNYDFTISLFEPNTQRMTLGFGHKDLPKKEEKKDETENKEEA